MSSGASRTRFGQVTFADERAKMVSIDPGLLRTTLHHYMSFSYGPSKASTVTQQTTALTHYLINRLRTSPLTLIKNDAWQRCQRGIPRTKPENLAALPPVPSSDVFALEQPYIFDLTGAFGEMANMTLSVIVPFIGTENEHLPFDPGDRDGRNMFIGFGRLTDQAHVYGDQMPPDQRHTLRQSLRHNLVWAPTLIFPMDEPLNTDEPSLTMDHWLRTVLHRASIPVEHTVPKRDSDRARAAGVSKSTARRVRTVELRPRRGDHNTGTGRTINWQFDVTGHDRHYRDEDGNIIRTVTIEPYTKGRGKPKMPKTPRVTVARDNEQEPH